MHTFQLSAGQESELDKALQNMVNQLWGNQGFEPGRLDAGVVEQYASQLWEGVSSGFGKEIPGADWETPDQETLRALRTNTWQFSAAKNHQQMASISRELIGPDGTLRSFEDFRDAANRINIEHTRHLRTEYNTAVAGGQMAGKWERVQSDKDTLPFLQFDAVMDGRVTDTCAGLDGVIRRVDDAFWKRFYPPNHFNCRSTVRQLADATETPLDQIAVPDIPSMFQTNLGEGGMVFPPGHPYFVGAPEPAKYFPREHQGKGRVFETGIDKKNPKDPLEQVDRKNVAGKLADHLDTDVYVLPELDDPEKDHRYGYFYEGYDRKYKQPDFKIGSEFWEMESYERDKPFARKRIGTAISRGAKQSDVVVIKLHHEVRTPAIERYIEEYFTQKTAKKNVKRVLVAGMDDTIIVDFAVKK